MGNVTYGIKRPLKSFLDAKNYVSCWGWGLFIVDAPYCLYRAQNLMKNYLDLVYTGFNFFGQVDAGRWKSKNKVDF